MGETDKTAQFIDDQRKIYGSNLSIEKVINKFKVGVADVQATYKGMHLKAESKLINDISLTNIHPFRKIQLHFLNIEAKAGCVCIGLLLSYKYPPKYIMYDQLSKHITKEQFLNAEEFNFDKLRGIWLKSLNF